MGGLTIGNTGGNGFNHRHYAGLVKSSPEAAKEYIARFNKTEEVEVKEEVALKDVPLRTMYKEKFGKFPKPGTSKEEIELALNS